MSMQAIYGHFYYHCVFYYFIIYLFSIFVMSTSLIFMNPQMLNSADGRTVEKLWVGES
jgi:hypothetical protein